MEPALLGHLLDRVVPELARGLQGLTQRYDLLLGPGARDLSDTPRLDNAARFIDVAQRRAAVLEHQGGVAGGDVPVRDVHHGPAVRAAADAYQGFRFQNPEGLP